MRGAACLLAAAVCASLGCSEAPKPLPPAALPAPAAAGETSPQPLVALESSTLALEDALHDGQWSAAWARLDDVRRAWSQTQPIVGAVDGNLPVADGVEDELSRIGRDMAASQPLAARSDVLDVLDDVADLRAGYLVDVPPAVLRLEVALRRVRLDADVNDWSAAERDTGEASVIWSRKIEAAVGALERKAPPDTHGVNVHRDMPAALERLSAAVASRNQQDVSAKLILAFEEVTVLRQVFAGRGDFAP